MWRDWTGLPVVLSEPENSSDAKCIAAAATGDSHATAFLDFDDIRYGQRIGGGRARGGRSVYRVVTRPAWVDSMVIALICANSACSPNSGPGGAGSWIDQGAGACAKFLSAEVAAAIFTQPGGAIRITSPHACSYTTADGGSLTIALSNAGPADFEQYQKYLDDPRPLPGVGDRASRSALGIAAVQGADRHCSIDARGPAGSLKLHGAELGRELGAICNRLFALP